MLVVRSEKREERSEESVRSEKCHVFSQKGIKSIAQRQATKGSGTLGRYERGNAPCKGKSPIQQAGSFTFAPSGRHAGRYATQGVALCYVVLPLQGVFTPQGLLTTHSSLLTNSKARLHPKSSGDSRKDGNDDLQDLLPDR